MIRLWSHVGKTIYFTKTESSWTSIPFPRSLLWHNPPLASSLLLYRLSSPSPFSCRTRRFTKDRGLRQEIVCQVTVDPTMTIGYCYISQSPERSWEERERRCWRHPLPIRQSCIPLIPGGVCANLVISYHPLMNLWMQWQLDWFTMLQSPPTFCWGIDSEKYDRVI